MYYVICPQCGTENAGSWLECEKCNTSLVGLQRKKSSETPPEEAARKSFVYDVFIDENLPARWIIPQSHCSSCFAEAPSQSTFPQPAMSSVDEYQGGFKNKIVTHNNTINLQFPLCNKCFWDHLFLEGRHDMMNYDPNYKENPTIKRVSTGVGILLGISILVTLFLLIFQPESTIINNPIVACVLPILLSIALGILLPRVASYDKGLEKGLKSDAKMRYRIASVAGRKGEYPGRTLFKSGSPIPRYHYQLVFENEQYHDLVAEANK